MVTGISNKVAVLKPYTEALMLTNAGIDEMQARTMVYYAYGTHYIDTMELYPILVMLQNFGCGKTDLVEAYCPMCNNAHLIEGTTYSTIRDELNFCRVAVFDENEAIPEGLLRKRFKKQNSQIQINRGMGHERHGSLHLGVFGATIVAIRSPFKDTALMSRCLIISPEYVKDCNCSVHKAPPLTPIIQQFGKPQNIVGSGRTMQVWKPLENIAKFFDDIDWISWASQAYTQDCLASEVGRQFEPREAVFNAVEILESDIKAPRLGGKWVKISTVKEIANSEFDQKLKAFQISAILAKEGKTLGRYQGYPVVELKPLIKRSKVKS